MTLTKTIYKNNTQLNIFNYDNDTANNELINLLLNKIDKKYKITISKDSVYRTIKARLYFTDNNNTKYIYDYIFENVNNFIDLY